jgi:polyhydroxyalkanoate synthesis regulator phasin
MFNSVDGTFFNGMAQITRMHEGGSPVLYVDYQELSESLQKRCDMLEQDNSKNYWDIHFKDCALKSARLAEEKAKDDLKDQYVRNGNLMEENSCLKVEKVFYEEQIENVLFNEEQINKYAEGLTEENFYLQLQNDNLKQKNAFLEESIRLILAEQKEETQAITGENNALHQKVNALEQTVKDLRDKIDSLTKFVLEWA